MFFDVLLSMNDCNSALGVDVVRSRNELVQLSPLKIFLSHPVVDVNRGGDGAAVFRSMFCSFALRQFECPSSSVLCECAVCVCPPHAEVCERVSLSPSDVRNTAARLSCPQGRKVQSVGGKVLPLRSRSVNVANCFLLSLSLVLISLSEWLVLHCYHRKEFRRKGC